MKWTFLTIFLDREPNIFYSEKAKIAEVMPQTERVYECAQELALTWLMEKAKELLDGFPVCYSIIAKRSTI